MIGLDFPKLAEKYFGDWSWRMICAGALMIVAAGVLSNLIITETRSMQLSGMQRNPQPAPERVVLRWRDRQDPRGFVSPAEVDLTADLFGLAWISGSDISVRPKKKRHRFRGQIAYELTDVFAAQTLRIEGRRLWVHEYLVQGARTGDIRRAALHASTDPLIDAIIVSLNPVWLYNDWAVYTESNQRASIVTMAGATAEDWFYALRYSRPSSILAAMLSRSSVVFKNRQAIAGQIPHAAGPPFPLAEAPEAPRVHYPAAKTFYPAMTAPRSMKAHEGYRATLLRQTLSEDGQNARFFCLALRSLAASGKPTLLFASPLPPGATEDAVLVEFMMRWVRLTEQLVQRCGGANIRLHTESWRGVPGERVHRDIVHLRYGQAVVDEINRLLIDDLGLKIKKKQYEQMYGGRTRSGGTK